MKKSICRIFILIIILQTQNSFSQTNSYAQHLNDTIHELNFLNFNHAVRKHTILEQSSWNLFWILNNRYEYKYHDDYITEVLFYNEPFDDTISRTRYTYDLLNRITSETIELNDDIDNLLKFNNKKKFTYSNKNSLKYIIIQYDLFDETKQEWQKSKQETFVYNSFDHLVEKSTHNFINNAWIREDSSSNKFFYQYLNSLSDKIKLQVDSMYINGTLQAVKKTIKKYNAINIEIERTILENKNGWDTLIIESVETDSLHVPICKRTFTNKLNQNYLIEHYKIDSIIWDNYNFSKSFFEQSPISHCISFKLDSTYYYSTKYKTLFHDSLGSYTSIRYSFEMNIWKPMLKNSYYFDNKLNLIQKDFHNYRNNEWELIHSNKYLYNYNNDDLVEIINKVYNNSNKSYDNKTKDEYLNYINVGTNKLVHSIKTSLYPNPSTNGSVNINVNLEAASALTIKVSDMKGSIVYTDERNVGKGLNTIELKNLRQGMYVVELSTELGVSRTKLIVQ